MVGTGRNRKQKRTLLYVSPSFSHLPSTNLICELLAVLIYLLCTRYTCQAPENVPLKPETRILLPEFFTCCDKERPEVHTVTTLSLTALAIAYLRPTLHSKDVARTLDIECMELLKRNATFYPDMVSNLKLSKDTQLLLPPRKSTTSVSWPRHCWPQEGDMLEVRWHDGSWQLAQVSEIHCGGGLSVRVEGELSQDLMLQPDKKGTSWRTCDQTLSIPIVAVGDKLLASNASV